MPPTTTVRKAANLRPTTNEANTSHKLDGSSTPAPATESVSRFSLAQYVSLLSVHLILLGFTVVCLPRTARLFVPLVVQRMTDRAQTGHMETLATDPLLTAGWISAGLVLLEVWWAGWMRMWSFVQTSKGTTAEMKLERVRFDGLHFTRLKDATVFTMCAALAIHIVIVAFGAPIATHVLQTIFLAFIVAILTAFTPAFVLGLPSMASDTPSSINRLTWTRLFVKLSPRSAIECALVYPTVGTFIGSWAGALPIALDWDRPWQAWPLPPLFGSIGGYIMGTLFSFSLSAARYLAAEYI